MRISKRFTVAISALAVGSLLYGMSSEAMAEAGGGGGHGGGSEGGAHGGGSEGGGEGSEGGARGGGYVGEPGFHGGPSSRADCSRVPDSWWSFGISCTNDFPGGNALLIHYKGRANEHDLEFKLTGKPGHDSQDIIYRDTDTNLWWNPNYYSQVAFTLADDSADTVTITDSDSNNPLGDPKGNACLFENHDGRLAWATDKPCTPQ